MKGLFLYSLGSSFRVSLMIELYKIYKVYAKSGDFELS